MLFRRRGRQDELVTNLQRGGSARHFKFLVDLGHKRLRLKVVDPWTYFERCHHAAGAFEYDLDAKKN